MDNERKNDTKYNKINFNIFLWILLKLKHGIKILWKLKTAFSYLKNGF